MNQIDPQQLRQAHRSAVIIAAALVNGCVLFGAMIFFLAQKSVAAAGDYGLIRVLAIGMGGGALLGSFASKKIALQRRETGSSQKKDTVALAVRLTTSMLVALAMVEGAVLFGLTVAFLSRNPADLIVPAVIGVIGFAAHFPRYDHWENWAREQ